MSRFAIHMLLHIFVPALVARIAYKQRFYWAWAMMLLTMLVDIDHLWANPVLEPSRCSIGFHLLHSYWAIGLYSLLFVFPKTRLVGLGLIIHMLLDGLDCMVMGF